MSGFKDGSLNREIASSTLSYIVSKIIACFEKMIDDYSNDSIKIANKENVIRDHLFSKYLDNDEVMRNMGFDDFRFFSETPVNYINGQPQGRTDLHVISIHEFRHRKKYFTIECKRLDGNTTLNRKYIGEGMRRFLGESPKYSSLYQVNGMLGFVVKCIDIASNVEKLIVFYKPHIQKLMCKNTYMMEQFLIPIFPRTILAKMSYLC